MKATVLVLVLVGLLAPLASAQRQAVVKDVSGKVELQPPKQAWVPAKPGMKVAPGTMVSTGFNSTAVLDLGGSVLSVRPLTRMRLEDLVEKEGTVETRLFLQIGRVKADVKSAEGVAQDFKVKSPVSTASVRGTGFEYDGYDLYVYDGMVTYSNLLGQERTYGAGEQGGTSGSDTPTEGQQGRKEATIVDPLVPGLRGEGSDLRRDGVIDLQTGGVIIVIPMLN